MKRIVYLPLFAVFLCVTPVSAKEFPHFFEGIRPLGMGGAFTAVADDENALFYNPAGLSKVEKWSMALINPIVESSESNSEIYKDVQDADLNETSEVTELIRDHMGETAHFRGALFPHVVTPNFGIGILGQAQGNIEARNLAYPEMMIDVLGTASGHVGYGHAFFDDILRVGVGVKYVSATRLNEVYTAADIADPAFEDRIDDDQVDGSGFGVDAGIMATAPVLLKPTVAVTILNIGDVDLGDAGLLSQQVNIGASVTHDFSWLRLIAAADYMDILEDAGTDDDRNKRLHFGIEGKMPVLSLRAGMYQGFEEISYGATIDLKILKLEYANYAEELSSYSGGKVDRRHVAQVSIGW